MKFSNIEDRLAQVAAIVVLLGVSFAAEDALATDTADVTTTAVAIHEAADKTLETAARANAEAAANAARSLALQNWIDLDIRLEDHSSTQVAGKK